MKSHHRSNRLADRFQNSVSGFVILMVLVLSGDQANGQDGFRPMFSDAQLSGWVRTNTPAETWRWQDGVLYCTGKPTGEIRTESMYQNFIMELEWRHLVPRGNAGVFVWADDITSRGVPFHRGIEVQVLENDYGNTKGHTTHGDIFPIHGAKMIPQNGRGGSRAFPTESRSKPSPQWNHYRIECVDGEITLAVNGKVVTSGRECVPRKGYICLESEGGVVEYRNIRIKELPDGEELSPEQIAIENRGYHSIYTGLDLSGWSVEPTEAWRSRGWILEHAGQPSETGRIETESDFSNSSFVVDVQLKDPNSNAVIRVGSDFQLDLSQVEGLLEKQGRWNRIEIIDDAVRRRVEVNGQEARLPMEIGTLIGKLVVTATGPVSFANLYATGRQP